jgi:predicted CXXCH cytochrome family protein
VPDLCVACHVRPARITPHVARCTACHDAHSSEHPAHVAAWPSAALCGTCHGRKDRTGSVHTAVREGDCLGCHVAHDSAFPSLLREANDARLCFLCHEDDATGRASVHAPVAQGKCGACHGPHGSGHPASTRASGKLACTGCHARITAGRNVHQVIERDGCTPCHDPHGSGHRVLLVGEVNPLCQGCHPGRAEGGHATTLVPGGHPMDGVPDPHAPDRPLSCVSCHSPHASDSPKLLRHGDGSMQSCDFCHGDRSGRHPELKDIHRAGRPATNGAGRASTSPSAATEREP